MFPGALLKVTVMWLLSNIPLYSRTQMVTNNTYVLPFSNSTFYIQANNYLVVLLQPICRYFQATTQILGRYT